MCLKYLKKLSVKDITKISHSLLFSNNYFVSNTPSLPCALCLYYVNGWKLILFLILSHSQANVNLVGYLGNIQKY